MKSASEVRKEAAKLASLFAKERGLCGDIEGAGEFKDLASAIRKIKIKRF